MGLFERLKNNSASKAQVNQREAEPSFVELMDDWDASEMFEAVQRVRLLNDSIELVFKTVYPKTFFYRYGFAIEQAQRLLKLSRGKNNEYIVRKFLETLESGKTSICNDFLVRCFMAKKLVYVEEELQEYMDEMSDESYDVLLKLLNYTEDDAVAEHRSPSLFAGLALFFVLGSLLSEIPEVSHSVHSHYCNGDCANCPPHYGYRYGRWYYGRAHQGGCERGGNGGAYGHCYLD